MLLLFHASYYWCVDVCEYACSYRCMKVCVSDMLLLSAAFQYLCMFTCLHVNAAYNDHVVVACIYVKFFHSMHCVNTYKCAVRVCMRRAEFFLPALTCINDCPCFLAYKNCICGFLYENFENKTISGPQMKLELFFSGKKKFVQVTVHLPASFFVFFFWCVSSWWVCVRGLVCRDVSITVYAVSCTTCHICA